MALDPVDCPLCGARARMQPLEGSRVAMDCPTCSHLEFGGGVLERLEGGDHAMVGVFAARARQLPTDSQLTIETRGPSHVRAARSVRLVATVEAWKNGPEPR